MAAETAAAVAADADSAFADLAPDPRRGAFWPGAAPTEGGAGRIAVGVGGGWLATWKGLQVAGGGAALDAAWAVSPRVALTVAAGVGAGTVRERAALGAGDGWAALAGARWLVVDAPRARVAPFFVAAVGRGAREDAGTVEVPTSLVGGGVAFEVPFYGLTVDIALPVGGVVTSGALPDGAPLTPGPFAPLFLLAEAGFTWRLSEKATFRLGYVALAASWSWRWHEGPWTLDISGQTNLLTGHLATRVGRVF